VKNPFSIKKKIKKPDTVRVCSKCLSIISRGKLHQCNKSTLKENCKKFLDSKSVEQLASSTIKSKISKNPSTSSVEISCEKGRKLKVAPKNQKISLKISASKIIEVKTSLNLSQNQTNKFAAILRSGKRGQSIVENNIKPTIYQHLHKLDNYFTSNEIETAGSTNDGSKKIVVNCKNLNDFLDFIYQERNIVKNNTCLKLCLDGGGGFLKWALQLTVDEM
jgi:hypothetical protein